MPETRPQRETPQEQFRNLARKALLDEGQLVGEVFEDVMDYLRSELFTEDTEFEGRKISDRDYLLLLEGENKSDLLIQKLTKVVTQSIKDRLSNMRVRIIGEETLTFPTAHPISRLGYPEKNSILDELIRELTKELQTIVIEKVKETLRPHTPNDPSLN